ncbi:glycosyltransferase family 2 protein [Bradyrhizobium sp. AZCC 1721]|uniref:glycosyltransferase family 2 protein n=1 Tax=Bradyrhizobium sp. AZCC 1721 TaxID=3117016 RepID=UPI002FF3E6B5
MQGYVMAPNSSAVDLSGGNRPLVSIGIPTFNRPAGLRRTLQLICGQTYSNLEILVSDNASPGSETERAVQEFSEVDARIKYFRQPANIGPIANFRFVLANASGEYFMWAADDDEWDARFVETCLAAASPSCSVMTKFNTLFRARNVCEENPIPELSPNAKVFQNVENYFSIMQPSLFYGLHPRRSILFTLKGSYFDFYDCYVVLRIILENDFRTIDQNLYGAGVDAPTYEVKYADAKKNGLDFWPFFLHSAIALARCSRLSNLEKVRLLLRLLRLVRTLRSYHATRSS